MTAWAYPLNGGAIMVDSTLELAGAAVLSSSGSHVFVPGKPVRIRTVKTAGTEYRVLQMATVLRMAGETSS